MTPRWRRGFRTAPPTGFRRRPGRRRNVRPSGSGSGGRRHRGQDGRRPAASAPSAISRVRRPSPSTSAKSITRRKRRLAMRRAAGAAGDSRCRRVRGDVHQPRAPRDDQVQFLDRRIAAASGCRSGRAGRGQQAQPRRRADQREGLQLDPHGAGGGPSPMTRSSSKSSIAG